MVIFGVFPLDFLPWFHHPLGCESMPVRGSAPPTRNGHAQCQSHPQYLISPLKPLPSVPSSLNRESTPVKGVAPLMLIIDPIHKYLIFPLKLPPLVPPSTRL